VGWLRLIRMSSSKIRLQQTFEYPDSSGGTYRVWESSRQSHSLGMPILAISTSGWREYGGGARPSGDVPEITLDFGVIELSCFWL
jgi:hypothetical protein